MQGFLPILAQSTAIDQPVTLTFIPSQVITWIIVGMIAGYLANVLLRGRHINPAVAALIGILGAIVGSFLFSVLRISVSPVLLDGITIRWIDLITASIGAIIILALFLVVFRRR